eukprot:Gb_15593 [translate_table: standard]
MAGGVVVASGQIKNYAGGMTVFIMITSMVAVTGGLIFVYNIGISGDVSMNVCRGSDVDASIPEKVLPQGLITSFFALTVARVFGRKQSMLYGGCTFLIIGRILLIISRPHIDRHWRRFCQSVKSVPVYLSEMAPAKYRRDLNMGFQLMITIGILIANLINYGTQKIHNWGWHLLLALAAVPAVVMIVGSLGLPDMPNSLKERGHLEKAKTMLVKIRGPPDIQAELDDMIEASENSKLVKHPWRNVIKTKYRPQLGMALAIPFFQQLTGINVIMFYAPVLFKTIGFSRNASLLSAVITGLVNAFATLVSIFTVDKYGRRVLFLQGGVQMFVTQVAIAAIMEDKFGSSGEQILNWSRDTL